MDFKDAAIDLDDATTCLFGEELSLSNRNQQVIGLASVATDVPRPYDSRDNKDLVFMDMKKLAQYLASTPRHPMNNQPLTVENIAQYAFRIGGYSANSLAWNRNSQRDDVLAASALRRWPARVSVDIRT